MSILPGQKLAAVGPGGRTAQQRRPSVGFLLVDTLTFGAVASAYTSQFSPRGGVGAFRAARWGLAQLGEWYALLVYSYHGVWVSGVSSADINEGRNRIELRGVTTSAMPPMEQMLRDLDVPCYLVALYPANASAVSSSGKAFFSLEVR
jgi:hypothetical protein